MAKITSVAEFQRRLHDAIARLVPVVAQVPERELLSIQKQLEALESWTKGGQKPTQAQKDELNFGLLASRYLDEIDQKLAQELYSISSWVIYW